MSGQATPMNISAVEEQIMDSEFWDATASEEVTSERESSRQPTNSSEGDDEAEVDEDAEDGDDGEETEDGNKYEDENADGYTQACPHMPEYQDKLMVIHDRITRIVNRMSCLTQSLKQVHQGLKSYTNDKPKQNALAEIELKKAVGDVGSTQTDPPIKPELNMLAERVGDSVACQTIEDNPYAC